MYKIQLYILLISSIFNYFTVYSYLNVNYQKKKKIKRLKGSSTLVTFTAKSVHALHALQK